MIRLVADSFDPGAELARFAAGRETVGAIASFVGLARGERAGETILELEAYPGFTEAGIAVFVEEARRRFHLLDAAVVHRVGEIAVGEPIVLVLTASTHRGDAFAACEFLMDHLKSRAAFWKKEHGPNGPRWVEPTAGDLADAARWGREDADPVGEEISR
jgi:molybdopterin synthase catalytic subunit